jgi:hypothetical protein
MKRVFNLRNTAIAVAALISTSIHATEDPKTAAVEFKFIGNFRNKPVFELNFNNKSVEKDYVLNIKDEFGNSLYRETINGEVLNKKFMLNTDEVEDDVLRVEITSRKNNHTVVYEINRSSHTTEEISISKLN